MQNLNTLSPWLITLILTLFTWLLTTIGSAMVFFVKKTNKGLINFLLAVSAGIMIASSFFSLIIPALEMCESLSDKFFCCFGILCGGIFVVLGDIILGKFMKNKENDCNNNKKSVMLMFAISLHNIPEGMSIGVMVASVINSSTGILPAIILAFGIGLQNFPEGASVSLPMLSQNVKKSKAFLCGVLSGIVEPIFAIIACLIATKVFGLLMFLLSFSAGTMICVSCTELISEASNYNKNLASFGLIFGFFFMMLLDILL